MRVTAIALACLLVAVEASAQVSGGVAQPAGYKDPTTATLLSVVIPGGGQFYAGETGKGAAILGATTGGFVLAAASSSSGVQLSGLGLYLASYIYGIADASRATDRHNAALKRVSALPVAPYLAAGAAQSARLGLTVSLGAR